MVLRLVAAALIWILSAPLAAALPRAACARAAGGEAADLRVVSMNPSLTEILVALGARSALVGVDEYSAREQVEVRALPTVGGLFNPSLEAVVALDPDLVVLVPSAQQRDFRNRLEALGVGVLELPNINLGQILESIEILGECVGRREAARERVAAIRRTWGEVEEAVAGRPRLRAVLVIQRDPLFVVGRGSFIDAMLRAAGVENAAAVFAEPYPRAAMEWMIAAAPEVILDSSEDPADPVTHWSRWPSIPAVAAQRTIAVPRGAVTRPGPYLDRALRILAEKIHGPGLLPREGAKSAPRGGVESTKALGPAR
jgi:iron complex transport system substrate-binding protein